MKGIETLIDFYLDQYNISSERPSRLKGIETVCLHCCRWRFVLLCSERPSRLKGIETEHRSVIAITHFFRSERPSRLKGIETLLLKRHASNRVFRSERPSRLKGIETQLLRIQPSP